MFGKSIKHIFVYSLSTARNTRYMEPSLFIIPSFHPPFLFYILLFILRLCENYFWGCQNPTCVWNFGWQIILFFIRSFITIFLSLYAISMMSSISYVIVKREKKEKKEKRRNIQLHVNLISFVILTSSKKKTHHTKERRNGGGRKRETYHTRLLSSTTNNVWKIVKNFVLH